MSVVTSPKVRHATDWYVEPAWCVEALFRVEPFIGGIHDPACGGGTIVRAALASGYGATGSDIVDRNPGSMTCDFLRHPLDVIGRVDNIVCNPPYNVAAHFIRQALMVARHKVAMIVQQQFPFSQRRHALFTTTPLSKLYFLSDRPSMPPGDLLRDGKIEAKGGSVDYLWMVWDHAHRGPPTAHWLRRSREYDAARNSADGYALAIAEQRKLHLATTSGGGSPAALSTSGTTSPARVLAGAEP